ncbi:MAG: S41 family peptidase [Pseudomonadota bacterium]|nr:S41 family peptidase [Pseudomonadota bacterium]
MKPLAFLTAAAAYTLTIASPAFAEDDPAKAWLSQERIIADIAIAEDAYSRVHPGYTRYASAEEMRDVWQGIRQQAQDDGGMTAGDFYLALNLALTNIRCDHTKAELPAAMRKARAGKPLYLPFRWELIEGRGLIDFAVEGSDLSRGDEILAIDGRPLSSIAETVGRYIPVDGFTEWSRESGIAYGNELMGGGVDHFGALLWEIPATATLKIRRTNGVKETVKLPRIDYAQWLKLTRQAGQVSNFKDAVRFERLGENSAILSVDTFVNYRTPVDPQDLYRPVFKAMREEGRNTLILDLRRNGGGSTDASMGLVANLVPDARPFMLEFRAATLDHTPWDGLIGTWDKTALNPDPRGFIENADGSFTLRPGILEDTRAVEPTELAFDGKLIILTSSGNSSGSTNILAHLASRPDTITVGEKTGGSAEGPTAGVIFFLTLPESKARLRIPMFRQWNNTESFETGMGITPAIEAPMTVRDFIANRDPALEKAKMLARGLE